MGGVSDLETLVNINIIDGRVVLGSYLAHRAHQDRWISSLAYF